MTQQRYVFVMAICKKILFENLKSSSFHEIFLRYFVIQESALDKFKCFNGGIVTKTTLRSIKKLQIFKYCCEPVTIDGGRKALKS